MWNLFDRPNGVFSVKRICDMKLGQRALAIRILAAGIVSGVLLGTTVQAQGLLLYEPFDYPNGVALIDQRTG